MDSDKWDTFLEAYQDLRDRLERAEAQLEALGYWEDDAEGEEV